MCQVAAGLPKSFLFLFVGYMFWDFVGSCLESRGGPESHLEFGLHFVGICSDANLGAKVSIDSNTKHFSTHMGGHAAMLVENELTGKTSNMSPGLVPPTLPGSSDVGAPKGPQARTKLKVEHLRVPGRAEISASQHSGSTTRRTPKRRLAQVISLPQAHYHQLLADKRRYIASFVASTILHFTWARP